MLCFSIVLWLRWLGKSAPKNGRVRRTGCPRCQENLHHACARERFGSQNRQKPAVSGHFLKSKSPKFAPCLRARAIWKSKSLKTGGVGAFFEVEVCKICTAPAHESDLEVKTVKTPGSWTTFGGSKQQFKTFHTESRIRWVKRGHASNAKFVSRRSVLLTRRKTTTKKLSARIKNQAHEPCTCQQRAT